MKQLFSCSLKIAVIALVIMGLHSCTPEDVNFQEAYLYGTWQDGTLFEKYLTNGTGTTWDTADDVTESEAQAFTWTLVTDQLTHIHLLEMGGSVPKVYTVVTLTENLLVYEDNYGNRKNFVKVN